MHLKRTSFTLQLDSFALTKFCSMETLIHNEDQNEMYLKAKFHQDLHCLQGQKYPIKPIS